MREREVKARVGENIHLQKDGTLVEVGLASRSCYGVA